MRALLLAGFLALTASSAVAQVSVDGYVRRDGTYVAPHYRSAPNNNIYDNYSTRGNSNPYSGSQGTVNPYSYTPPPTYRAPSYNAPSPYTAPRRY